MTKVLAKAKPKGYEPHPQKVETCYEFQYVNTIGAENKLEEITSTQLNKVLKKLNQPTVKHISTNVIRFIETYPLIEDKLKIVETMWVIIEHYDN